MKIAVTGASGFIGRHVLSELAKRSIETIALVRPNSTFSNELSAGRIVELDLHQPPSNAFELMECPDVLIHLAWAGLPNYRSEHHMEQELPGHYRFLKGLVEAGLQALVVSGTCLEYGMQSGALNEDLVTRPSNSYGLAKDALRCQLENLKTASPYQLTWARLFYLFGEGQAETALLPQLSASVEKGDTVFNMSGGEQLRDYLPVAEVASHIVSLALAKKDVGVVNVCSGTPISVRRLVEGWIEENSWAIKPKLGHYPYPDYEPLAFWGDPEKLYSIVGKAT